MLGRRGCLGGLLTPYVVLCAGGMSSTLNLFNPLLLLQAVQKWQLGCLVSSYLLSRICPKGSCMQRFLVPYSFCIFLLKECPGSSTIALQRVLGPSLSQHGASSSSKGINPILRPHPHDLM